MSDSNTPQGQDSTENDAQNTKKSEPQRSGSIGTQAATQPDHYYAHPQRAAQSRWQKIVDNIDWSQVFLDLLLILIGVKLACIYSSQLKAMLKSNEINREALESVQRAFIFLAPVEGTAYKNSAGTKIKSFSFRFPWENSGVTPTRNMATHVNWTFLPGPLPNDFSFPDLWSPGQPHINAHVAIGPKGSTNSTVPVSIEYINAMLAHKAHLYFWGWAKYRDIFPNTPDHLTEFCMELTDLRFVRAEQRFQPEWVSCISHNCYDEECAAK